MDDKKDELLYNQEDPGELLQEEWYKNTYEIAKKYSGWIKNVISKEKGIDVENIKKEAIHSEWLEQGKDIQFIYATVTGERIYVGADFKDKQLTNIRIIKSPLEKPKNIEI